MDYIQKNGSISNKIYQELTGVTRHTASSDLQKMVENGILQRSGKTQKLTYTLT
jgi:predicted HTH transcriptional regulator